MFGSRKNRPPNPPLIASTANPSAATAALSALNGTRRGSNTSTLSAAAAAAALKARPTTPTNVAEVQTKRTRRRSASQTPSVGGRSSSADRQASSGRPEHLRTHSSLGSMTERTFRSPSPGTSPQRSLGGMPQNSYTSDQAPPPVPAIRQSVNMKAARAREGKPKSLSLVTMPVRTASQKMAVGKDSPGSWFGAAKVGDATNVRTSDAILTAPPQTQAHVQTPQDNDGRPSSRNSSVNFSYPARVRVASPTATSPPPFTREDEKSQSPVPEPQSRTKRRSSNVSLQRGGSVLSSRPSSIGSDQALVYDPNSRRMVPQAELLAVEQLIQTASEAPPKKKKHIPTRAGSHLSKGTMGRPRGSATDPGIPTKAQKAAAASLRSHRAEERPQAPQQVEHQYEQPALEAVPEPPRPSKPELDREIEQTQRDRHSHIPVSPASNAPEVIPEVQASATDYQGSGLQRRPSIVREEEEGSETDLEELEAPTVVPPNVSAGLDAVPVRQNTYADGVPSPPRSDLIEDQPGVSPRPAPAELVAAPKPSLPEPEPKSLTFGEKEVAVEPRETQLLRRESRAHSNSPVRTARFGSVQENLTVKHEPPARSISPRKSALKQTSPSRGASPSGDDASEASGAGAGVQEPALPSRKKSVRVSFDDENTVVMGESAGRNETDNPISSSPQPFGTRRPWYSSLSLGRKKEAIALEDDEIMKPRPALPSFGSIRGRKQSPRPPEERPLVRPYEPIYDISGPASPGLENRAATETGGDGHSSDHALGGILHGQGLGNEANTSKFREPLPPVVTSIEGSGYASDSTSEDSESALMADTPKLEPEESRVSEASALVPEAHGQGMVTPANGSADGAFEEKDLAGQSSEAVPAISITRPSPRIPEEVRNRSSYIRFPGSFPEAETESDIESWSHAPTRQVTFEPVVQREDAKATAQTPSTVLATQSAAQDPAEDSDGSSIYSDAYEDLSEMEGDGFQSLDAVVESPLDTTPPKSVLERAQVRHAETATPTPQPHVAEQASGAVAIPEQAPSKPIDDWETAKAYWKSLSTEKRAQLEKEAEEEAGADGDLEETQPEEKKPRRKKSVEKRNAEKKALGQQKAAVGSGRVYMIKPGTRAELGDGPTTKTATRSQPEPESGKFDVIPRMRKTLRGADAQLQPQPIETGTRMRRSLRPDAPEQGSPKRRPESHEPMGNITTPTTNKRHSRAMSESAAPTTNSGLSSILQPSLKRRGSDSSTSSFKRSRSLSQGFGFRKTMRGGAGSLDQGGSLEQQLSRFSLRPSTSSGHSTSPPVSLGNRMRTTLRGRPDSQRRNSQDSAKGYLPFSGSFGRSSDKGKSKKTSRFADDSSDDEDVPRRFASRFDDSSDEDITPEPLRPLSMPKTMRGGRGKSTPSPPLPEEEELSDGVDVGAGHEKSDRVTSGPAVTLPSQNESPTTIRRNRSGRGSMKTEVNGGHPSSRRSIGFMSTVLRRNKKHDIGGKVSRPELMESAARRDTNLERSTNELTALRSNSLRSNRDGQGSPRFQKRISSLPSLSAAGHWPLSHDREATGQGELELPEAADEGDAPPSPSFLGHSKRQPSMAIPTFLHRRTMSHQGSVDTEGVGLGIEVPARRKKKFGVLRRMFKLDD